MTGLLTLARDLKRRKARTRTGLFVAEGIRTAEELLDSALQIEGALIAPALHGTERGQRLASTLAQRGLRVTEVTETEFATASETDTPQGVLLLARVPEHPLSNLAVPSATRLLVLDGVQDPGNTGTLLRTAAALGAAATIAMPGTVDLWNAKVVRSSMGSLFRRPAAHATWPELDEFLASNRIELWGADGSGDALEQVTAPTRLALAVGNEGHGLTAACRARASRVIAIALEGDVESLNVAVAAGIILHHLRS